LFTVSHISNKPGKHVSSQVFYWLVEEALMVLMTV